MIDFFLQDGVENRRRVGHNVENSWANPTEPFRRFGGNNPRRQTCHFAPAFSIPSHLAADFGQHLFPADLGAYIRDAVTVAARLRWWDVGTFLSSVGVPAPNFPRPRSADSSPKWWCQPGFDTKLPALAMAHRSHLGRQHRCSWRPPRSAVCLMGFWGTDILMAFFVRRFWGWNPAPLQEQIDQTPNTKMEAQNFWLPAAFQGFSRSFPGENILMASYHLYLQFETNHQQQTDHRNAPGPSFGLRDLCKAVDRCVARDLAFEVVPISSPFPHAMFSVASSYCHVRRPPQAFARRNLKIWKSKQKCESVTEEKDEDKCSTAKSGFNICNISVSGIKWA